MSRFVEVISGLAYLAFVVSLVLAIGSAISRPGSRRFRGDSYREIVRVNPPAAFFVVFGRKLPLFVKAVVISGAVLVAALVVQAIVS